MIHKYYSTHIIERGQRRVLDELYFDDQLYNWMNDLAIIGAMSVLSTGLFNTELKEDVENFLTRLLKDLKGLEK